MEYFSFVEIEKGDTNLFALDSLSIQDGKIDNKKNIPLDYIPEELLIDEYVNANDTEDISKMVKSGNKIINNDLFCHGVYLFARFVFNRESYDKALLSDKKSDWKKCFTKVKNPWNDKGFLSSMRRLNVNNAIASSISIPSEIKGIRASIKNLYDTINIPYTEDMIRFDNMLNKIKEKYSKVDLDIYSDNNDFFKQEGLFIDGFDEE